MLLTAQPSLVPSSFLLIYNWPFKKHTLVGFPYFRVNLSYLKFLGILYIHIDMYIYIYILLTYKPYLYLDTEKKRDLETK